MTKDEVKALCEADPLLQWWAMVLFAELQEVASPESVYRSDNSTVAYYARAKADEFPRIVIQRQIEKAKAEQAKTQGMEILANDTTGNRHLRRLE